MLLRKFDVVEQSHTEHGLMQLNDGSMLAIEECAGLAANEAKIP